MKDIVFVTAQPDVPYFHWQIKLYVHNFIEKGIDPNQIHVILALVHGIKEPSKGALELKELGVNIHFYEDNRDVKSYIPSIKPYLVSQFLNEFPKLGKKIFLHDADIIFRTLPDFKKLAKGGINYLSDTIGYIGYDYIMYCCNNYETRHPNSEKGQLIKEMASVVGIDVEIIKENQKNSGGGQYIIKNTDYKLWEKIYLDSFTLYNNMLIYQRKFPINPGQIQFWTAEMWAVLWNLWMFDYKTKVVDEIGFSWATDNIEKYKKYPILHMAGVTDDLKKTKFYKGDFINVDPIKKLIEDPTYFDYVDSKSSTIKYIEVMRSYIEKTNN
jgi:hypothetical protein